MQQFLQNMRRLHRTLSCGPLPTDVLSILRRLAASRAFPLRDEVACEERSHRGSRGRVYHTRGPMHMSTPGLVAAKRTTGVCLIQAPQWASPGGGTPCHTRSEKLARAC